MFNNHFNSIVSFTEYSYLKFSTALYISIWMIYIIIKPQRKSIVNKSGYVETKDKSSIEIKIRFVTLSDLSPMGNRFREMILYEHSLQ